KTRLATPKDEDPESEVSEDEIPTDEDPEDEVPEDGAIDGTDGAFQTYFQKFIKKYKPHARARDLPQPLLIEPHDDDDVYTFSSQKAGLAVIINNEEFDRKSKLFDREGAKQDARNLKKLFKHLGFQIKYYKNLTARQMVNTLQTFAGTKTYDMNQVDCFACAILSHGHNNTLSQMPEKEDLIFGTDGKPVLTRHLLSIFNDEYCPELQGKPRLFLLQACRGNHGMDPSFITVLKNQINVQPAGKRAPKDATDAVPGHVEQQSEEQEQEPKEDQEHEDEERRNKSAQVQGHKDDDEDENRQDQEHEEKDERTQEQKHERPRHLIQISPSPIYKDFLVLYAATPGHAAWRNRDDGSWMIQCLTKVMLSEDVFQTSLTSLLREVTWKLAMVMANDKGRMSVPCVMSMLTKEVYFKKKN
ncbi:caspase-3-like, partial [Haliotis rubra]|uniref:caspase-3-like n=1 Tax=Haliotis rubra TaxID=36100 RepID=UPI001EE53766